jgi:exodeoxyribonuclease VII large subunit
MVASIRIDLTVDRADGEVVGALGACWDPHNQTWFLDAGVELAPFAPWLPAGDRVDPTALVPSDAEEPRGVPLSEFLVRVKGVVNAGLAEPVWVRAEIRKVQVARSKHVYLELEERDAGGLAIASTKGVIWAGRAPAICGKFSQGTGGDLKPDIKVLVKVKADFHPVHGFDLIVEDIDPSFTLGDLLAKLGAIRDALRAEDIYDSYKRLPRPEEFVRVAVICPATSAGQGDFRSEADRLQQAGLCEFDYFTATFQGGDASQSIRDAVRAAYDAHKVRPYDALAIIRGGGSVTDLAWLNDLKLARWVCRVPIPVLTGIGHERDSTILDEVAHRRFDTPSKVALHIAHAIRDDAWKAIADLERIRIQVARILTHRENALASGRERLDEQVARILEGAGREVARWDREIRATASHHVRAAEHALGFAVDRMTGAAKDAICDGQLALQRSRDALVHRTALRLGVMDAEVERHSQAVAHRARAMHKDARAQVESLARAVIGMGPQSTLRRGYAVVRDAEGGAIGSKADAMRHEGLSIQFRDGTLAVSNREYQGEGR